MGDGKTPLTVTSDSQRAEFALYEGDQADPGKLVDTFRVRLDGTFESADLDAGTYTIVETKAPDGYNLPKNAVTTIVISDNDPDGVLDDSSAKGNNVLEESVEAEKNVLSFKIWNTNDSGFELPTTGGMGTVLFTVVGLALMGGAIVLIVLTSKKKKAHN